MKLGLIYSENVMCVCGTGGFKFITSINSCC